MKPIIRFIIFVFLLFNQAKGQQPISVGSGSFASYTPLEKSKTDSRNGSDCFQTEHKRFFITEAAQGKPIPTNDWWTDLLLTPYSGNLWAYPQLVKAESYGIYIEYPTVWSSDGCEMKSKSRLEIAGKRFKPQSASANNWHDWGFNFIMQDDSSELKVTLCHGIPFTWLEAKALTLSLRYTEGNLTDGVNPITLPYTNNRLAINMNGDLYGIYVPDGSRFEAKNGSLDIIFPHSDGYIVVALLPSLEALEDYANYAYNIPRKTAVEWEYDEVQSVLSTQWHIETENLITHATNLPTLQGFIPHHYKNSSCHFSFTPYTYNTPRGKLKLASGNTFTIAYSFNGLLPYFPKPQSIDNSSHPYQQSRLIQLITEYANKGYFGADTYWGGKGLTQMANYMVMAYELGETELFEQCKNRLKDALVNWYTYTPGEKSYYFSSFNRWGALVGQDVSYGSDQFNDHHFHYGYFTYATSLLCLFDPNFKRDYGEMATLVAKDYANWDKTDTRFPFFRTLDPWAGHSYAGGFGSWSGNGQESTSEAMQGWGGVYLLGVATNNKAMRDAGIFGWILESRGTAEYWFDRDRENIDYSKFAHPYNSNLTSQGIGWWTWFSGDPVWMHSIQWLPMSPLLKYLYEDLEFARWDYTQMWQTKQVGDWSATNGLGQESGLGNVVLSYLQIFDPDSAAAVYDTAWEQQLPLIKQADTGGIGYYMTHSQLTYGDIDWSIHADYPTSTTYKDKTGKRTYVVYNPNSSERLVNFYNGTTKVASFKAAPNRLSCFTESPIASSISISSPNTMVLGSQTLINATIFDQYGASIDQPITYTSSGFGAITDEGLFIAGHTRGEATITASSGNISISKTVRIDSLPYIASAQITPKRSYLPQGSTLTFTLDAIDQYGEHMLVSPHWQIESNGILLKTDSLFNLTQIGSYDISATIGDSTYRHHITVLPPYPNLALHQAASSSSDENAGTKAHNATDGSINTRWSSTFNDNEWISVDLSKICYIDYLILRWENSYATLYTLMLSEDGTTWKNAGSYSGGGGTETVTIDTYCRYIKLIGNQRSSQYGISLYELEAYGVDESSPEKALWGIDIQPKHLIITEGETIQLEAVGYNRRGEVCPITQPVWRIINDNGTISSTGELKPSTFGEVIVSIEANTRLSQQAFLVEESLKTSQITIHPKQSSLIIGDQLQLTISSFNQFGTHQSDTTINYKTIGKGAFFDGRCFTSTHAGDYQIIAYKGTVADTAYIHVGEIAEINLALNKSIVGSSWENDGLLPAFANDGQLSTRWSSAFKDNQYLIIDLESPYVLTQAILHWESAYASSYLIEGSLDEEHWQVIHDNPNCQGGIETLHLTTQAARYVKITCINRNSNYGFSISEIELYGSAHWSNPHAQTIILDNIPSYYIGESYALSARVFDQYGLEFATQPNELIYQLDDQILTTNTFIPQEARTYSLKVSYNELSQWFSLDVKPKQVANSLHILSDRYKVIRGQTLQLDATVYDQYGNKLNHEINWSSTSGTIDKSGIFCSNTLGLVTISAQSGSLSQHITLEVIDESVENLALLKPTTSSSGNSNMAVDGNSGTRWESDHTDGPHWIMVNLNNSYYLTQLVIDWETASAADYLIEVSTDGNHWQLAHRIEGKNGARSDSVYLSHPAQYVRLYCTKRSSQWGYSIFELKVYGVPAKARELYMLNWENNRSTLLPGESFTYTVGAYDHLGTRLPISNLLWNSSGGSITQNGVFEALEPGEYIISAALETCKIAQTITVETSVSREDIVQEDGFTINQHNQHIEISGRRIKQIKLYSVSGLYIGEATHTRDGNFNITSPQQGIYLLVILTETSKSCHKIVAY